MRIVLDAMGGDRAPLVVVDGAVQAAQEHGVEVVLVGRQPVVEAELAKYDTTGLALPVVHASQVGEMEEHTMAVQEKRDSSRVVGMKMVRRGESGAFVPAGNSGGVRGAARCRRGGIQRGQRLHVPRVSSPRHLAGRFVEHQLGAGE